MIDFKRRRKRKAARSERKRRPLRIDASAVLRKGANIFFVMVGFTVTAALLQGCWMFLSTSGYFGLSHIIISGNDRVSREDVLLAGGLAEGRNIFSFNVKNLGREIEEIPWVREVLIERKFPDSLNIFIEERRPAAILKFEELYYVDAEGYVFAKADSETGWDFPVIAGIDKEKLISGDKNTFALMEKGIEFLNSIKGKEGRLSWHNVSELKISSDGGITVYPVGAGIPLYLGKKGLEERFARAEKVLSDLVDKGVKAKKLEADFDDRVLVKVAI